MPPAEPFVTALANFSRAYELAHADETFVCEVCGETRSESDMDSQILANHPTFKCVCSACADPIIIKWGIA